MPVPAAKIQPLILGITSEYKKLQLVICGISNNLDVQYEAELRVSQFRSLRKHHHFKRFALGMRSLRLGLNKFETG